MRNRKTTTGWLMGLLLLATPVLRQNYEQMAQQIVHTSAGVKPGELVLIKDGQHTMPLMETIAVEDARAGGHPAMLVSTDKVERAVDAEMPESAIQAAKSDNWQLQSGVVVTLPALENNKAVLAGVTPARQAIKGP